MGALSFMGAMRPRSITMTNEEKKKIYAALAAPFPEHCIQRTEGRTTGRGGEGDPDLQGAPRL